MNISYFKVLFIGVTAMHLFFLFSVIATVVWGNSLSEEVEYFLGGLLVFGVLSCFATVYETMLEEGFGSGFLSFLALALPVVGSYFLFSFLIKEISKENEINAKNI